MMCSPYPSAGNYLSLRGEHEKAVVYFQRALKLNPKFVSAYTLMGYEYMEMKNTIQAIQCYRNALSESENTRPAVEVVKIYELCCG